MADFITLEIAGWLVAALALMGVGVVALRVGVRRQQQVRAGRLAEGLENLNPHAEKSAFIHDVLGLLSTALEPCRLALWLKEEDGWVGYTLTGGGLQEARAARTLGDEPAHLLEAAKDAWQRAFASATRIVPIPREGAYLHFAAISGRHLPSLEEARLLSGILNLPFLHRQDLKGAEQSSREVRERLAAFDRRIKELQQALDARQQELSDLEEERERLRLEAARVREEADQQIQRATGELMKTHQEMDTLREQLMMDPAGHASQFAGALDALMNPNFLLELILETAMGEAQASIGSIMLLDKATQKLEIKVSRGLRPDIIRTTRIALGDAIAGFVAKEGRPLLIEDIQAEPRFMLATSVRFRKRSFISVPIKLGDRVLGVLNLSNKEGGRIFTQEELRVSESLAARAGAILEAIPATDEPLAQMLRSYLTPHLAARLDRCLHPLEGIEALQSVTLVGVRIHGVSRALKLAQPYLLAQAFNRLLDHLAHVLETHQGMLDQGGGTWLMGVFGLPFASEGDALRAVQSGVEMIREKLSHPDADPVLRHLALTVGVATGTAVVGPVGPGVHRHHTVVGDVVNLCQRLQLMGVPGQLLMDEPTAKQLEGRAELRAVGSLGNGEGKRTVYAFQQWVSSEASATQSSQENSENRADTQGTVFPVQ